MSEPHCIITGDPVNGFKVTGPFDDRASAQRWAKAAQIDLGHTDLGHTAWLLPIDDPDLEFGPFSDRA
jgi:hypothetical protein